MRTIYGPLFTLRPYERGIQEYMAISPALLLGSLPVSMPQHLQAIWQHRSVKSLSVNTSR